MKIADINFTSLEQITLGSSGLAGGQLGDVIERLLPILFSAAGILLLIYLTLAGYQYLTSAGEPGKTAAARAKIINGLVGIVIVFVSYWIVQFVAMFLGLTRITEVF